MLPKNLKLSENKDNELIILPQWKRKNKIIIRAKFNWVNKDAENIVSNLIWKMWVFN